MSSPPVELDALRLPAKRALGKRLVGGLLTFAIPGLLTFAASVLYTSYRFDASRNVAFVPVQVEVISDCVVDLSKLNGYITKLREEAAALAVEAIRQATATDQQSSPLVARAVLSRIGELVPEARAIQRKLDFLDVLALSADENQKVHARRDGLQSYLPIFEKQRAVTCEDESSLSIDVAILVEAPKVYLISGKNCMMTIGGYEPVPVRLEPILSQGPSAASVGVDVFPVSDSTWARATYTRTSDTSNGSMIGLAAQLMKNNGKYMLTVSCPRLNRTGLETVGGERYLFNKSQVEGAAGFFR